MLQSCKIHLPLFFQRYTMGMDDDLDNKPQIPVGHYLSELKKAMEALSEMFDAEASKESILERLEKESIDKRPWHYIQSAFVNHDNDINWLKSWCKNSQTLL